MFFKDTSLWKFGTRSKIIVRPQHVSQVKVHQAKLIATGFRELAVAQTVAQVHHYRRRPSKIKSGRDCLTDLQFVNRTIRPLIHRVLHVCKQLDAVNCTYLHF